MRMWALGAVQCVGQLSSWGAHGIVQAGNVLLKKLWVRLFPLLLPITCLPGITHTTVSGKPVKQPADLKLSNDASLMSLGKTSDSQLLRARTGTSSLLLSPQETACLKEDGNIRNHKNKDKIFHPWPATREIHSHCVIAPLYRKPCHYLN